MRARLHPHCFSQATNSVWLFYATKRGEKDIPHSTLFEDNTPISAPTRTSRKWKEVSFIGENVTYMCAERMAIQGSHRGYDLYWRPNLIATVHISAVRYLNWVQEVSRGSYWNCGRSTRREQDIALHPKPTQRLKLLVSHMRNSMANKDRSDDRRIRRRV